MCVSSHMIWAVLNGSVNKMELTLTMDSCVPESVCVTTYRWPIKCSVTNCFPLRMSYGSEKAPLRNSCEVLTMSACRFHTEKPIFYHCILCPDRTMNSDDAFSIRLYPNTSKTTKESR